MGESVTVRLPEIWEEFKKEKRALIILVSSAMLLTVAWYHGYYTAFLADFSETLGDHHYFEWYAQLYQFLADIVLLVLIPFFIIKVILHEKLSDFGIRLGDWRFGLKFLAVAMVVMAPGFYITGTDLAFQMEYPLTRNLYGEGGVSTMILWELTYLIYYIAWEIHFRGFQQLGMEKRVGPALSILIMMLASTLIHVRKPFNETFSAIFGAFLIGVLAWRTRSIIWGILLHWYIGASTDFWCWHHAQTSGFWDYLAK
jgi:CAAX protease family protein